MFVEVLPDLDLSLIDIRDTGSIAIQDLSSYLSIPGSDNLSLQITPPGYDTVNVPFIPGSVNIYKCADLGITCSDTGCTPLPDGIYEVMYSVSALNSSPPVQLASIDRKFIKIDTIRCKYQKAFGRMNIEALCCNIEQNQYWKQLRMIKLYIDGSVAECLNGNYRLCFDLYQKANTMLDKLCGFERVKWSSTWKMGNCNW